jgi:acyl-CoA thioester hydrolase
MDKKIYTTGDFTCLVPIMVQWGDMDALGHVNNSVYFRYVETARLLYLEQVGGGNFRSRDDVPVVAHLTLNFRQPVVYPAQLLVGVRVPEMRTRSFVMECAMFLVGGGQGAETVVADGSSVIVWIDKRTGGAIALPELLREAMTHFEGREVGGI